MRTTTFMAAQQAGGPCGQLLMNVTQTTHVVGTIQGGGLPVTGREAGRNYRNFII
jgi:hypothetical protein